MANTTTLSSKNQVTLPKAARQAAQLKPGDKFKVTTKGSMVILEKQKSYREYFGAFKDVFPQDAAAYVRELRERD